MQPPRNKRDAFKWLWAVAELPASMKEKALLWPLALHADINGQSYPGEATLRRESGLGSESTLRRTLRQLERRGWIKTAPNTHPVKIGHKTYFTNTYTMTMTMTPGRAVRVMTGHDTGTGGQNEGDGRSQDTSRAVNSSFTGGQSYDRETARGTARGTARVRKSGSLTRKDEFVSVCNPRIIQ